jgi:hypothetical protein
MYRRIHIHFRGDRSPPGALLHREPARADLHPVAATSRLIRLGYPPDRSPGDSLGRIDGSSGRPRISEERNAESAERAAAEAANPAAPGRLHES